MGAVLGQGSAEHWVAHVLAGSFTAPGTDERLALVGNVGGHDEIRWVVVGQGEAGQRRQPTLIATVLISGAVWAARDRHISPLASQWVARQAIGTT